MTVERIGVTIAGSVIVVLGLAVSGDLGGAGRRWIEAVEFLNVGGPLKRPRLIRIYSGVLLIVIGGAWMAWSISQ